MTHPEEKLKALSEESEYIPAVAIVHGWLALLRDHTELPGQLLEGWATQWFLAAPEKPSKD